MPKVGDVLTGVVFGILDNVGAKVKLPDNKTGFIHISEVSGDFVKNVKDYLKVGQEVQVKVVEIDTAKNRISLSIKRLNTKVKFQDNEEKQKAKFEAKMLRFLKDSNDKLKDIQRNKESKQGVKRKIVKKK